MIYRYMLLSNFGWVYKRFHCSNPSNFELFGRKPIDWITSSFLNTKSGISRCVGKYMSHTSCVSKRINVMVIWSLNMIDSTEKIVAIKQLNNKALRINLLFIMYSKKPVADWRVFNYYIHQWASRTMCDCY